MNNLYLLVILLLCFKSQSQEIKCNKFLENIELNGNVINILKNSELNSDWLFKVTRIKKENIYYIIAEIKKNKKSTKKYVYCNIPNLNWKKFQNNTSKKRQDFGKRFWKYIIEYKCKCK